MKHLHHRESRAGGVHGARAALGSAGRAACIMAILCLPGLAQGSGGNGSGGGELSSGGDETIGTLPILGRENVKLPMVAGWRGDRPAFYLEGTTGDLQATVLAARGHGFITIEVLDPTTHYVRAAFHGNVSVVFDRELIETLPIQTGVAVPASFAPQSAILMPGTQAARSVRLRPGVLPLAVGELSAVHALNGTPLEVRTFGGSGRVTTTRVYTSRDKLILRQSN